MITRHTTLRTIGTLSLYRPWSIAIRRPLHTTSPQLLKTHGKLTSCRSNLRLTRLVELAGNRESETHLKHERQDNGTSNHDNQRHSTPVKAKTVSQADAELRERLEQMSGEGGASGIEYEDGKPNAMKRGVRNNMFRLI